MACPAVLTGSRFLASTLGHIDCQAQVIGSYGYGALADPSSTVALALTGLLTIFIALFGIRMLLGHRLGGGDAVSEFIKIGLVLTFATSWPAWRVVGYDLVMNGPAEVARSIGLASGLPGGGAGPVGRLQNVDDGLVAMTTYGTGRLTGGVAGSSDLGDSFHGIALADETGLGWGRVLFLSATIGPLAVVRLGAGLLLALAPLMAGLLFFGATIGLFVGWIRGLVFVALGALALSVIQSVELGVIEPWIADVLDRRDHGTFTPAAPTELLVLAIAFVVVNVGMLGLIARMSFHPNLVAKLIASIPSDRAGVAPLLAPDRSASNVTVEPPSRAHSVAEAVATTMRSEAIWRERHSQAAGASQPASPVHPSGRSVPNTQLPVEMLGSSFRRGSRRASTASTRRDQRS